MREGRSLLLPLRFMLGVLCAGCVDTAVVGVDLQQADGAAIADDSCEPACSQDERCHPELHVCVRCVIDHDCARDLEAPFCDAQRFVCVQCKSPADCSAQAPRCAEGTCRSCDESPNCVGTRCPPPDNACRIDNRDPGGGSGGSGRPR